MFDPKPNQERLDDFFRRLRRSRRGLLFLDYDGTLAPFRVERDDAVPYEGVRERLEAIIEGGHTRLVIVTGRALRDAHSLLGLNPPPEIWGSHAWERRMPKGRIHHPRLREPARSGLAEAAAAADEMGHADLLERKPAGLALHWRGRGEMEIGLIREQVGESWSALAARCDLELTEFDGGLELRAGGRNKGVAVRTVLAEEDSEGAAAYLGDDLTDEDGFRAIEGRGLSILVRDQPRTSAAQCWIRPPEELPAFLDRWLEASAAATDPG